MQSWSSSGYDCSDGSCISSEILQFLEIYESRITHLCQTKKLTQHPQRRNLGEKLEQDDEDVGNSAEDSKLQSNASLAQRSKEDRHTGVMVFLRGSSAPHWLNSLGAMLDVDPELFT